MKIFTIIHQISGQTPDDANLDLIGVYGDYDLAIKIFNVYLNSLEKVFREEGNPVVFNRFSEIVENRVAYASCPGNSVWVFADDLAE